MNIAVCGLQTNWRGLFLPLYTTARDFGHQVSFFEPETTGKRVLSEKGIAFELSESSVETKDFLSPVALQNALRYDCALIESSGQSNSFHNRKKTALMLEGQRLAYSYSHLLQTHKIDAVLVWGGMSKETAIASAVARTLCLPCIHYEKGWFPFTLQSDIQGVNAKSSIIQRMPEFHSAHVSAPLSLFQDRLACPWHEEQEFSVFRSLGKIQYYLSHGHFEVLFRKLQEQAHLFKAHKISSKSLQSIMNDPGDNSRSSPDSIHDFIFLPLQVRRDSQMLCHSPWLHTPEEVVRTVAEALGSVSPGTTLVVKPHPADWEPIDLSTLQKEFPQITICQGGTLDILRRCRAVVTVNSTVGFEAMMFQKPVLLLGAAAYAIPELFLHASDRNSLAHGLKALGSIIPDEGTVLQYASFVDANLLHCNFLALSEGEIRTVWDDIALKARPTK